MTKREYDRVCYMTEQRDEQVAVCNIRTGICGQSVGCTESGTTIQVRLADGGLDSWSMDECRAAA